MLNFKNFTEATEPKDKEQEPAPQEDTVSEIGEWTKQPNGWIVKFNVGSEDYVLSLSPVDQKEEHWQFTYYKHGFRTSSDSKKFGDEKDWLNIWSTIVTILKDFVKLFKPITVKFIGMTISKRSHEYKRLFKLYTKHFVHSFKKFGYHVTFDNKDLQLAPTYVIKKAKTKEKE